MRYTTTVKLMLDGSPTSPLSDVKIVLYDRDRLSPDDLLGTSRTNAQGEARFDYTTEQFDDIDEKLGGDMPEIYAVIYDSDDKVVLSTRSSAEENYALKRMTIPVPRDLAQSHRLIPTG